MWGWHQNSQTGKKNLRFKDRCPLNASWERHWERSDLMCTHIQNTLHPHQPSPPSHQRISWVVQLTNVSEAIKTEGISRRRRREGTERWRYCDMMESQGGANRKMKHGGRSGFGVLPALTGLPTSISCQRCSKMVARAAFRCTGKRGSLLRMEWMRKGRGGGKRQCSGGRGEREGRINNNPSSFSVFQSSFASFPSVMW